MNKYYESFNFPYTKYRGKHRKKIKSVTAFIAICRYVIWKTCGWHTSSSNPSRNKIYIPKNIVEFIKVLINNYAIVHSLIPEISKAITGEYPKEELYGKFGEAKIRDFTRKKLGNLTDHVLNDIVVRHIKYIIGESL